MKKAQTSRRRVDVAPIASMLKLYIVCCIVFVVCISSTGCVVTAQTNVRSAKTGYELNEVYAKAGAKCEKVKNSKDLGDRAFTESLEFETIIPKSQKRILARRLKNAAIAEAERNELEFDVVSNRPTAVEFEIVCENGDYDCLVYSEIAEEKVLDRGFVYMRVELHFREQELDD